MANKDTTDPVRMEKIVSLCKRRGFIFQSSEIYGGLAATYDYGPLGSELKRNVQQRWWDAMTRRHDNVVGIDAAILMHPDVWKASGHVDAFHDPMIDDKVSKVRYRADQLIENHINRLKKKRRTDRAEAVYTAFVDALNADDVDAAFVDKNYRAVISTIGCFKCEVPPDYLGNKNIFDAARAASIPRVILISSIGAGDSADAPPWISKWILKDVMALKTQAEDHLRSTGVGYTIIRPGGLKDGDPTGNGLLTEDVDAMGIITRADLAKLMVDALDDPAAANKVYSAMDSELSWPWDMWD